MKNLCIQKQNVQSICCTTSNANIMHSTNFDDIVKQSVFVGGKKDRHQYRIPTKILEEYRLSENGVKVISATELIPDGAIGIIVKAVLLGINEYYSADLSEKSRRGSNDNAEKCLYNGGTVPFGFKIKDKKYVIDEDNAKWVEKIFTMYANGSRIVEICNYMNSMGIKSSRGAEFNKCSMQKILENEKYIGVYTYSDTRIPNGVPRIISDELFERVQKQKALSTAGRKPRSDNDGGYLLSGKLFCGNCKEKYNEDVKMVGHSAKSKTVYYYYKCNNVKDGKDCDKKLVPKEYIEDFVIQKCRSILTDKNITNIAKKIYAISQKNNINATLNELLRVVKEKKKAKDNVMNAFETCTNNTIREELFLKVEQLKSEIEALETEIAKERTKTMGVDEQEIRFFLTQFRDYDILNVAHRKALINLFVNKIYLYDDNGGDKVRENARITIILNAGKNTVEITDELYADIKKNTQGSDFCLLNNSGHQRTPLKRYRLSGV